MRQRLPCVHTPGPLEDPSRALHATHCRVLCRGKPLSDYDPQRTGRDWRRPSATTEVKVGGAAATHGLGCTWPCRWGRCSCMCCRQHLPEPASHTVVILRCKKGGPAACCRRRRCARCARRWCLTARGCASPRWVQLACQKRWVGSAGCKRPAVREQQQQPPHSAPLLWLSAHRPWRTVRGWCGRRWSR